MSADGLGSEGRQFPVVTAWRQDGEFCVGSPSAFSDEKSTSESEALHSKSKEQGDRSDSCKLNNYLFLQAVLISAHGLISTCLPNRWFKHRS